MLRLAHGISVVLLATVTAPPAHTDALAAETPRACKPRIHLLPPLEGDTDSQLTAMNTRGWAVGTSWYSDPATGRVGGSNSVLWRDGVTLNLHAGGTYNLYSEPMDVNRQGVVAVQRYRARRSGRLIPATSWTWRKGKLGRLRGGQLRPEVFVEALNDHGVAVGSALGDSDHPMRPMVWRQGDRETLPIPPGASGWAVDINNQGLVVGNVHLRGSSRYDYAPWYWHPSGKSGPLHLPTGEESNITDVDNRGRILGSNGYEMGPKAFLWSSTIQWPRDLGRRRSTAVAMNDRGDLTGSAGGFRGVSGRAWTGHVSDIRAKPLPYPQSTESWQNTSGVAVIREVTSFAPQGGVSIGGNSDASPDTGSDRATIWTCTQRF